jgi:hypothetical protein
MTDERREENQPENEDVEAHSAPIGAPLNDPELL